jgi:N-acetylneuraminic acid mutarotase
MNHARADHAMLFFKNQIYVFGGMAFNENKSNVKSLNTAEVYLIKEDKWTELPSFEHARQAFSVCNFNDKFIFIFGGKVLKDSATVTH